MRRESGNGRARQVFLILTAFMVGNALIAECIGGKLFSLEALLGIPVQPFSLLGEEGLTFTLTCGALLWPLEFVATDIINEYYGPRAVRRISYVVVALILYGFFMFYMAIHIPADQSFWTGSRSAHGVPDMQAAFESVFGQGMWIIAGSLVAFLVAQLLDVWVFQKIKARTGEGKVWLRATGSTLVSQLVDSFLVLFIAFHLGSDWSWQRVLAIGMVNYAYKGSMAILLTPLIYLAEWGIREYIGQERAARMRARALLVPGRKG